MCSDEPRGRGGPRCTAGISFGLTFGRVNCGTGGLRGRDLSDAAPRPPSRIARASRLAALEGVDLLHPRRAGDVHLGQPTADHVDADEEQAVAAQATERARSTMRRSASSSPAALGRARRRGDWRAISRSAGTRSSAPSGSPSSSRMRLSPLPDLRAGSAAPSRGASRSAWPARGSRTGSGRRGGRGRSPSPPRPSSGFTIISPPHLARKSMQLGMRRVTSVSAISSGKCRA